MARMKSPKALRRGVRGKVLADELLVDGSWALVTTESFAIVEATGEVTLERPWHEVATGEWDDARHILSITWVDGGARTRIKTEDDAPVSLPRLFKERVDSSVVYSETMPVAGGVLRGALRRTPTGELISQVSSDGALRTSPALEQQIAALEQKLWDFVGI